MIANLFLLTLGVWGLYTLWAERGKAGSKTWLDYASPVKNPIAYRFAIGLRVSVFGACAVAGAYRMIFNMTG